ncbi:MAG: hypothetical protein ABIO16_01625 [Nocardioides sp.]
MPPVLEPLSGADLALLRRLVLEHKAAERRHRFPTVLHLGGPGRPEAGRVVEGEALDHALRCDILEALLKDAERKAARLAADRRPLLTWLSRPGSLEVQDADLAWLRAVRAVNGETDRSLPFLVVTRDGWRDPQSGVGRTWQRLRGR